MEGPSLLASFLIGLCELALAISDHLPLLIQLLLFEFSFFLLEIQLKLLKTLLVLTLKLRLTGGSLVEKISLAALDVCKRVFGRLVGAVC